MQIALKPLPQPRRPVVADAEAALELAHFLAGLAIEKEEGFGEQGFVAAPVVAEPPAVIASGRIPHTPAPPQCSFSFGRTIWLTWPITIRAVPRSQPWMAIRCMR
jgi:hypothetical protein